MTYKIAGLNPVDHASLFTMSDVELAAINAKRVIATSNPGFPCRVSLKDAEEGDTLILFHHVSHDVVTPHRSAYAIYVNEASKLAATYVDETPPVFEKRDIALRGFDSEGNLCDALLAGPGQADVQIRALFENADIAYIHAHNAAYGCFSAAIVRN
jgi:Protein of unknown function (DUF1203)